MALLEILVLHLVKARLTGRRCSNPRPSWVTYVILSNFYKFSQLTLSIHPLLLFYQLLSSQQTFIILSNFFSPFLIYSLYALSTHPINAPAVRTTNTTLTLVLSCAGSLHQYTFLTHQASLAPCHSDIGDRGTAGCFPIEQPVTPQRLETSSGSPFLCIGQMMAKRQLVGTTAVNGKLASSYDKGSAKKITKSVYNHWLNGIRTSSFRDIKARKLSMYYRSW